MTSSRNNQWLVEKQSALRGWLFQRLSRKAKATPSRKKHRLWRLYLPLTFSRGLIISLRVFRTNKNKRSKLYKQLVLAVYFLPFKEIAVRPISRKSAKKLLAQRRLPQTAKLLRLRLQAVAVFLLVALGVTGTVYFGLQLSKPDKIGLTGNRVPAQTITQPVNSSSALALPRSEPTRLRIAKIDLDTSLVTIGRNPDDTIEVPSDYRIAGWYKYSPTPGELGPAIIVGHVDNVNGIAVFWRLRELAAGDMIEIDRTDGKIRKFKVNDVKQFPRDSFPTQEIYGNIDYAGVRLITCGGVFNRQTHQYSHNTVVYASLIN